MNKLIPILLLVSIVAIVIVSGCTTVKPTPPVSGEKDCNLGPCPDPSSRCGWGEKTDSVPLCPAVFYPENICNSFLKCTIDGSACNTVESPQYKECVDCFKTKGADEQVCHSKYLNQSLELSCTNAIEKLETKLQTLNECKVDSDCVFVGPEFLHKPVLGLLPGDYPINKKYQGDIKKEIEGIIKGSCPKLGYLVIDAINYEPACKQNKCIKGTPSI